MNVQSLLAPRDEAPPSGENLEYDAAFIELEIAGTPGQERQAGNEIIAAEEPDHADVAAKAMAVMERSHDLRAGVFYANAVLNTEGLTGFAEATAYIRGCLEQYWSTCHPLLDADDDNDPTMRINAVRGLGAADTVLKSLRRAPLTRSRTFGRITLRDVLISTGELPSDTAGADATTIKAAFDDTPEDVRNSYYEAARAAQADVKAIDAIFGRETPGQGPDLDDLARALYQIVRTLGEHVAAPPEPETEAEAAPVDDVDSAGAAPSAPSRARGAPGSVTSRDDVIAALDAISDYYKRYEPSSPVPIIIGRARRLVKADFLEILRDLAPSGLDNVNMIGGLDR